MYYVKLALRVDPYFQVLVLLHKSEFGQTHCEEWFKRIHTKIIL
jgi:hypothetical protein